MIIKNNHKITFLVLVGIVTIQLFVLAMEINNIGQVGGVAAQIEEKVAIPIILYHSILESNKITDRYAVTPNQLESDLKYIRDNGYTTITMNNLIEYVDENKPLPEKPIIITFDDG